MKKILVPFLATATMLLVAPSALAAESKSESLVDTTTEITPVDGTEVTPVDGTTEIMPLATTISWADTFTTTMWSDPFYISSTKSSLKLNQVLQATQSWSTPAKVEYRLYKQSSGSVYGDTGIYDVLDGTYTYPNAGPCTLYGTISPGTYKIKMINKTSEKTSISGNISL
ncbi:hypothetical protein [Lysinibacillus boronitolerans]|uniref:hypothetical protein n=1 Tax=Lysinibacillus boronitolerans TaxID=309788 RepID=UPI0038549EB9